MIYNLDLERHIYETVLQKAVACGWYGNCVPVSIILSECLSKAGISNQLSAGYLHISDSSEKIALYHCWVETKLGKMDISTDICERLFPKTKIDGCTKICAKHLKEEFVRCDVDTCKERIMRSETEQLDNIYIHSHQESFWKTQHAAESEPESFKRTVEFRQDTLHDLRRVFW